MNGGTKRKWLKENRKQVLWIANNLGEDKACEIFNMKHSTLERLEADELLSSECKWTKSDKALITAKIAETGIEELRDQLAELDDVKEFYLSVIVPFMKLMSEYYDKLTAPERARKELLKVPTLEDCRQLAHNGSNLYVM
jgi:hypothetical protein